MTLRIGWLAGPAAFAAAFLAGGLYVAPATAQTVQFLTPEVGDRRVVLNWNRAAGDTLNAQKRRECEDLCKTSCASIPDSVERKHCEDLCKEQCVVPLFGGYQIWRATVDDPDQMILLRTYAILDTSRYTRWTFRGEERIFVDPDSIIVRGCTGTPTGTVPCIPLKTEAIPPFNGFPYFYAVTWFESASITIAGGHRTVETERQSRAEGLLKDSHGNPQPVYPAASATSGSGLLSHVIVVPNPFNLADPFQRSSFGTENRIQFIHIPSPATVRIYTVAGDLVRELTNDDGNDALDWDLKNDNQDEVAGGVYMFQVDTPSSPQKSTGHFVIIR